MMGFQGSKQDTGEGNGGDSGREKNEWIEMDRCWLIYWEDGP